MSVCEPEVTDSYASNEETAANLTPCISYEVSDKEAIIYYEGEDFRKSVFSVGGEMLYIYGIKPDESCFLGCMGKEEAQFREISVEIPENMRVSYMAVDSAGSGHMLWISTETTVVDGIARNLRTYEKVLITEIDKSGEVKKSIDVTALSPADALYLYLASGTDTELLLYNKAGGVYACDVEAGTIEQRISGGELPVSGVNVNGYGFLGDGRLCLLTEENKKAVFYYVPCGNIVP